VEVRQTTNNYDELIEFGSGGEGMVENVLIGDDITIL
jgi:hypothetical protein